MSTTDPAGWTAWDDLYAEFPTRRDAKIRALISKHRAAVEQDGLRMAREALYAEIGKRLTDQRVDDILRAERIPLHGRGLSDDLRVRYVAFTIRATVKDAIDAVLANTGSDSDGR